MVPQMALPFSEGSGSSMFEVLKALPDAGPCSSHGGGPRAGWGEQAIPRMPRFHPKRTGFRRCWR